jgi:hypothetical protein
MSIGRRAVFFWAAVTIRESRARGSISGAEAEITRDAAVGAVVIACSCGASLRWAPIENGDTLGRTSAASRWKPLAPGTSRRRAVRISEFTLELSCSVLFSGPALFFPVTA